MLALFSCSTEERREKSLSQLDKATELMEGDAEKALEALKKVNTASLQKDEYYRYLLLNARVSSMLRADISGMKESVDNALSHFISTNNPPYIAFAAYVQAKVYEANSQPASALSSYHSADYWAEKASYRIPGFTYIAIPYNIASYYKRSGDYQKSLDYLKKTTYNGSVASPKSYHTLRLHSLELTAIDYMYLSLPDSSFLYYDKAFQLAEQQEQAYAKQRITANRIEMLSNLDNVELAETQINSLLKAYTTTNDSAFISLTNLSLARVYTKTNRATLGVRIALK